jgi:3-hydroxyisobutyrate dehydrogenase-like beta-hydroxyacid dehydrogenase
MPEISRRVAVVGLGAMGAPMARVLLRAGHEVTVIPHRDRSAAQKLADSGATVAGSVASAAASCDVVIALVPALAELTEVADGLLAGVAEVPGPRVLLNMSTVGPAGITELARRLADQDVRVVDAPVSGGPARAADGTLTIMASGDDADIDGVGEILDALGGTVFRTGPLGTGQAAKLCNNLLTATIFVANAEVLTLAAKAGLDPAQVREIVLASSGGSTVLDTWVPRNVLRDVYEPGFALKLMHKDVGLGRDLARQAGAPLPLASLAHELYAFCTQGPGADLDYSYVSTIFQDAADITVATSRPRREVPGSHPAQAQLVVGAHDLVVLGDEDVVRPGDGDVVHLVAAVGQCHDAVDDAAGVDGLGCLYRRVGLCPADERAHTLGVIRGDRANGLRRPGGPRADGFHTVLLPDRGSAVAVLLHVNLRGRDGRGGRFGVDQSEDQDALAVPHVLLRAVDDLRGRRLGNGHIDASPRGDGEARRGRALDDASHATVSGPGPGLAATSCGIGGRGGRRGRHGGRGNRRTGGCRRRRGRRHCHTGPGQHGHRGRYSGTDDPALPRREPPARYVMVVHDEAPIFLVTTHSVPADCCESVVSS